MLGLLARDHAERAESLRDTDHTVVHERDADASDAPFRT